MGCGASNEVQENESDPIQQKQQTGQKQQNNIVESLVGSDLSNEISLVLPLNEQGQLQDISSGASLDLFVQSQSEDQNKQNLLQFLESVRNKKQHYLVIDTLGESVFWFIKNKQVLLDFYKQLQGFNLLLVVASSKTNFHLSVASFQYNLFGILSQIVANNQDVVKKVTFIERDTFYSSDPLALFTLLHNNPCQTNRFTCFPSNPENFASIKEFYQYSLENSYSTRSYVMVPCTQGLEEGSISEGMEYFLSEQFVNDFGYTNQNFCEKKAKPSQVSCFRETSQKVLVYFGESASKLEKISQQQRQQQVQVFNWNEFQCKQFSEAKNLELVYLISFENVLEDLKAAQSFFGNKIDEKVPFEQTTTLIWILPEDNSKWTPTLVFLATAIESFSQVIFFQENCPLNSLLLKTFFFNNNKNSLKTVNNHLVPYPRLKFFIPTSHSKSLITNLSEPINFKEENSIFASATFSDQFVQEFQPSESQNAFFNRISPFHKQIKIQQNDPEINSKAISIVHTAQVAKILYSFTIKNEPDQEINLFNTLASNPLIAQLGDFNFVKEMYSNAFDLLSEYAQYAERYVEEEGCFEEGEEQNQN